jgi:RND family efflux transporter MFP subunit
LAAGVVGTLWFQENQPQATGASAHEGHDEASASDAAGPASTPPPEGSVFISAARQQLIGVRTTEATHQTLNRSVRTVGTLAFDETRQAHIHTKVEGWAERVSTDFVGKPVRRGQALFSIYSPKLVATQKEYLLALRAQREFAGSEFEETRASGDRLVAAARERLRLWDISDAQIDALERTGEVQRTMTIYSPISGVVTARSIFPGQYVTPDTEAFTITDLSAVWAIGEVFEYELRAIKAGDRVTVEFPYGQASASLSGKVAFIYPDVDPQTRRGRVRVEFPNAGQNFKPGTFVTMTVAVPADSALVVPREAVIDTGTKQYVILAKAGGFFEPREVRVGTPAGDFYPITAGLVHGDKVVSSAQFLIDSETNLQAAMKAMVGHGHAMGETDASPTPTAPTTPSQPAAPNPHTGH